MFQHASQVQILLAFTPGKAMRLADVQSRLLATRGRTFSDITVRQALGHLVKAGKLARLEAGVYAIPGQAIEEIPLREFVFKRLGTRLATSAADLKRDYRAAHGVSRDVDDFSRELAKLETDGYAMPAPKHPTWYLATGERMDD